MSLNNISLPSQLLADLYQHSLVSDTATAVPVKAALSFLGKNGKNILIVVNKPDVPYLPDAELSFLTKVLTACQLSLMDIAIVNWSKLPQQEPATVIKETAARFVILFGLDPAQFEMPAETPLFTVRTICNRPGVMAPTLNEIESSKEAKGQLWSSLKQLFSI
ncbi:MAG: hypothetical protein M3Q06_07570 [Bacteroidota bacterium]|nr:hypothetical protein [Bacteroidota bacterium]